LTDLAGKAWGKGKTTVVVPAAQLTHCQADGEAREMAVFWTEQLFNELLAQPDTVTPSLVVHIVPDLAIPGTASIEDFLRHRKAVLSNSAVQYELMAKNHLTAAIKRVRCNTLMHCSLLMLRRFDFLPLGFRV
jgi:hypothetical protein